MKAWILSSLSVAAIACGGTFNTGTTHQGADSGVDTGGSSAGGSPGSGGAHAGGASAGGHATGSGGAIAAGGVVGAGGLIGMGGLIYPAGAAGTGTGGLDCSNVGCGAPPICSEGCNAPCGCCPCEDGQHQPMGGIDYVCTGGCFAPVAPPADGGAPACSHNGHDYADGQSFRAGDGCNTCTCASGVVGCTKMACACDPAAEAQQRNYVGKSPGECAVIDFACPANTTYFANDCGCGCEQGLGCPDWFDCMPGPGRSCDTNQIKTQCPYSGIAF